MSNFIKLFDKQSNKTDDNKQTLYINTKYITGFTHFKLQNNNCLIALINKNTMNYMQQKMFPDEYLICEETHLKAYRALTENLKYDN